MSKITRPFLIFLIGFSLLAPLNIPPSTVDDSTPNTDDSDHVDISQVNNLQIPFIKNVGQVNSDKVKFYAKTFAGTVFVTSYDLTYSILTNDAGTYKGLAIKEKFVGGSLYPVPVEKSETVVNYFIGNKESWKTNIPAFQTITLGTVWPSVDVNLKAHSNNIEKIFTVFPGGKIQDIKVRLDGILSLNLVDNGEIVVNSELGSMSFTNPIAYQLKNSKKSFVDASYVLIDSQTYGFKVQNYDPNLPLVIDPLIASTFIGGSGDDVPLDLVRDSSGNVYITGYTDGSDYPTTAGAYDTSFNGGQDVFVSKLDSTLNTLSASTFIGSSTGSEFNSFIALDSSGNVYITGYTDGSDYPTTGGAYDTTFNGIDDVFVSKFNSNLSTLMASTFIGGTLTDQSYSVALDSSGNVYITGTTAGSGYPTTAGAYDTTFNGVQDAFVSEFNSGLTALMASTFIGGSTSTEIALGITLHSSGNVYITGHTGSSDYPTTAGAFDTSQNGGGDAFVSEFNSGLTSLGASTFIGGTLDDVGEAIVLDSSGNPYITGYTESADYSTTAGAFDTSQNGFADAFVSEFNSGLTALMASTFIGGSSDEVPLGLVRDSSGNVYITGYTESADYPTTAGAFDTSQNGFADAFVSEFNSGLTSLGASTFIGGTLDDVGEAIVLDSSGNPYITGYTESADYPIAGTYDSTHNGASDGFVSYIDCNLSGSAVCLAEGGTVTIPVGAGGTAQVSLPTGNVVSVTLPVGASGTVTVSTTDAGASQTSLNFFGTIVDISTTAAGTKTVSFTFTDAQLAASGLSLSVVKIYEDINGDGSFTTNEALETTVTPSSPPGPFTAEAESNFQSKFAVGGAISVNALAGAGATLGFIQKNSCDPDGFGSGISLKLYKVSYDVDVANKLWVDAGSTCGPMVLEVVSDGQISLGGISMEQPRLDEKIVRLEAKLERDQKSFSIVLKDKRDFITRNFYISELVYEKDYTKVEQWSSQINGTSAQESHDNLDAATTSSDSTSIPDWIRSNAKWWSEDAIGDSDFVQGIQFLVKEDIIHIPQTQVTPSESSKQIPSWIKSNAEWWSEGKISDDDFVKGLQWLISNGIMNIG